MFLIKCSSCGAQSAITLETKSLKNRKAIKIEGNVEVYVDNKYELHCLCQTCGNEIKTE